ncbi:MAG: methionine biosynthesis protein MetW [Alteromonadaceae bacterium]|uniref:methionine biosynthesis protein MetW n=1 Tax=unclassified Marinobacter TaxID=83889 RepID=UPI000C42B9D2|nr:methionine biosynthesis protein MetW [Marinobacter sp. BGYM27]MAA66425.1 methionine biosynthesis protein MetW [Alteromonadaceae bacterium]MBH85282.1 methionine biosynthesis protein MetW [Alteromonadaceae bacterium]MDG5499829.1 methionine biosynthesis protein MetW [Marinobacter sp. BGYM27]|tara:strand:+ start:50020 stop:50613 length:594 start_codon:yes stop_codon:yes gene_type:complete
MRADLEIIEKWIQPNSHVLDLGCGDGTLLDYLQRERQATGFGLEINPEHITTCMGRGVCVIEQDMDEQGLGNFENQSFDVVLMTQALQAVRRPDVVLDEMLRLGRECIVTFPNFAYWRLRWYLMRNGRMPESETLPYKWYNTPNIHLCTFNDFEALCYRKNIKIKNRTVVDGEHRYRWFNRLWPNMLGQIAIYRITR